MDYFNAVREGRERVRVAVELLQEVAGPSYPMLFLKMDVKPWTPVGEESLFSIVAGKDQTAAVVLCDEDGNSKAMSGWATAGDVEGAANRLAGKGLRRYSGAVKLPV